MKPYLVRENIEGWMDPLELAWLSGIAAASDVVVELGSWKGRSTRALAHAAKLLICVDHWRGDGTQAHAQARQRPGSVRKEFDENTRDLRLYVREMSSAEFYAEAPTDWADLFFIDGSHDAASVQHDILLAQRVTRRGRGIIAGHDYTPGTWDGVVETVDEVFGHRARRGPGSLWYVYNDIVPGS